MTHRGAVKVAALLLLATVVVPPAAEATDCPYNTLHCQLVSAMSGNASAFTYRIGGLVVTATLATEDGTIGGASEVEARPGAPVSLLFAIGRESGNDTAETVRLVLQSAAAPGIRFSETPSREVEIAPDGPPSRVETFAFNVDACPPATALAVPFLIMASGEMAENELALRTESGSFTACYPALTLLLGLLLLAVLVGAFVVLRNRKPS